MKKSYSKQEKENIIKQLKSGVSISSIHQATGIARITLYNWFNAYNSRMSIKQLNMGDYKRLKAHCEKLENTIQILKNCGCTIDAPLHQRYKVIKELSSVYSITTLCNALNVAKGSYYNHIFRNKNEDTLAAQRIKELTPIIEEIYNNSRQTFGPDKVTAIMNDRGYKTSRKTVAKIMHENGWFSITTGAKKLYLQYNSQKENILKQHFNSEAPNRVWVSDVTYFRLKGKTLYICVILDIYARKIISYSITKKNATQLTKSTFIKAYDERKPDTSKLLFHSDQGFNYTSKTFKNCLKTFGIKQSFSRK